MLRSYEGKKIKVNWMCEKIFGNYMKMKSFYQIYSSVVTHTRAPLKLLDFCIQNCREAASQGGKKWHY